MMMFVSEIRAGPLLVLKVLILFADCIESPVSALSVRRAILSPSKHRHADSTATPEF